MNFAIKRTLKYDGRRKIMPRFLFNVFYENTDYIMIHGWHANMSRHSFYVNKAADEIIKRAGESK
jgi:hypothetical protein